MAEHAESSPPGDQQHFVTPAEREAASITQAASAPPVPAELLQADPAITHDVIELTEPPDPENTVEL